MFTIGILLRSLLCSLSTLVTPQCNLTMCNRDDGIAVCKATPREIEKTKQEVSNVFKSSGLTITIEANKKIVNFLDVTFNLSSGSYKPYMKPNNKLLYVHRLSNHPPALLKNIPLNINKRLTNISSSEQVFTVFCFISMPHDELHRAVSG